MPLFCRRYLRPVNSDVFGERRPIQRIAQAGCVDKAAKVRAVADMALMAEAYACGGVRVEARR